MEPYVKHESIAALMNRNNVDTDQIIPKQFLKKVERTGFGVHLFHDWRYDANGNDNQDFELNNPAFKGAGILVTGDNFGCGSSREHAPWAIADYGFKAIVSTSFADIFYNNCFKNCILPIIVSKQVLDDLMKIIQENEGIKFSVDLDKQQLIVNKDTTIEFELDSFRKHTLLKGLDDIALTLQNEEKINAFESIQQRQTPWLWS